jgi:hypothetical protein
MLHLRHNRYTYSTDIFAACYFQSLSQCTGIKEKNLNPYFLSEWEVMVFWGVSGENRKDEDSKLREVTTC